jgi:hypothetical protein
MNFQISKKEKLFTNSSGHPGEGFERVFSSSDALPNLLMVSWRKRMNLIPTFAKPLCD